MENSGRPYFTDARFQIIMNKLLVLVSVFLAFSCNSKKFEIVSTNLKYEQIFIKDPDTISTPTIFIEGLYLVTKDSFSEKEDALEILALKHKLPLAMKTKNSELFEKILSDKFIIRGEDEFLTKEDYITNRVHGTWTIDTVHYYNLVLQFFGNTALLTYKNKLDGTDDNGIPNVEYYSWADIYINEDGQWKILSVNEIDARYEYKK